MGVFGKWKYQLPYIIDPSLDEYFSSGPHMPFHKPDTRGLNSISSSSSGECPLLERMANFLLHHKHNSGKKIRCYRHLSHALLLINSITQLNPIQVMFKAIKNSG